MFYIYNSNTMTAELEGSTAIVLSPSLDTILS
jgi:hypothetical protein